MSGRYFVYGASTALVSRLVSAVVIASYGILLAIRAGGSPDPAQIDQFADLMGIWPGPLVTVGLTIVTGVLVARQQPTSRRHMLTMVVSSAVVDALIRVVSGGKVSAFLWAIVVLFTGALAGEWSLRRHRAQRRDSGHDQVIRTLANDD